MDKLKKKFFQPKSALDDFFEVGILLKLLECAIETIAGLALLIIRPEHVTHFAHSLTTNELVEDTHDFIASQIVCGVNDFTKEAAVFAAIYLLSHGIIKVVLVYEV